MKKYGGKFVQIDDYTMRCREEIIPVVETVHLSLLMLSVLEFRDRGEVGMFKYLSINSTQRQIHFGSLDVACI